MAKARVKLQRKKAGPVSKSPELFPDLPTAEQVENAATPPSHADRSPREPAPEQETPPAGASDRRETLSTLSAGLGEAAQSATAFAKRQAIKIHEAVRRGGKHTRKKSTTLASITAAYHSLILPHWKLLSIIVGCVVLFALALSFAFNDMEEPAGLDQPIEEQPIDTEKPAAPEVTPNSPGIMVEWHGEQHRCTPEFMEGVLDGVQKLARRDGNDCARVISLGGDPRGCLSNANVRYVAVQLRNYYGQKFNSTCISQQSFDAGVARAYYESYARYTKYPDIVYETPYPDVQDFVAVGIPTQAELKPLPLFPTVSCDAEWLRENRKELEHRENVAALTGTVSEELKQLRVTVAEMVGACGGHQ